MAERAGPGLLALALVAACAHEPAPPAASAQPAGCSTGEVERTLTSAASAQVIVLLQEGEGLDARRTRLLEELGADFQLTRSYQNLPGFAGSITRSGYERLRADRDVRCIQLDHPGSGG